MQVFISWSGIQAQQVAGALRLWIPKVLDAKVHPFMSSVDIDRGDRGLNKIAHELEDCSFGIIVVTPSNQHSAWINFEAGAIGKSVTNAKVAPLLVGMSDMDVSGPLRQFQNTVATDRSSVYELMRTVNKSLVVPLGDGTLETLFAAHWSEFEAEVLNALRDVEQPPKKELTESDLLAEVLTTVRSLQREMAKVQTMLGGPLPEPSEAGRKVAQLLKTELSLDSINWEENGSTFSYLLPDDASTLQPAFLGTVHAVAMKHSVDVLIQRPDGAWLTLRANGESQRSTDEMVDNKKVDA